jgi:hypothetical protein
LANVVLSDDSLNEQKIPHSGFVAWQDGKWIDGGRTDWWTAGTAVAKHPREQLCAVGTYGGVLMLGSGDRHEEQIAPNGELPKNRGPLRGVRCIGDHVYVVGMNRQAYRRNTDNAWVSFDAGARPSPSDKTVVGFEAVDGFSESEIYAVGWDGEIWAYDGKLWKQVDSPTNLTMTSLRCGGDGLCYAAGRRGLLVRGRGSKWDLVEHESIIDDIWGLEWYADRLYLATMDALYTLVDGKLHVVEFGSDAPGTCYHLSAGDGVLWSIGAKDLMAFDGNTWTRID